MDRNIFLIEAKSTATGISHQTRPSKKTFQAYGSTSTGAGSASFTIEVSNDNRLWLTAGNITLTLGTTETTDGFSMDAPWVFVRAKVTAISGTGANVSLIMGL